MGVIDYIPPKQKLIDHRSPDGGYYVAKCDNCGTEFYPERGNAKYCSPNCTLISWRKAKAQGKIMAKKGAKVKSEPKIETMNGKELRYYLKAEYKIPLKQTKPFCKELEVGETKKYYDLTIKRISAGKYSLVL